MDEKELCPVDRFLEMQNVKLNAELDSLIN